MRISPMEFFKARDKMFELVTLFSKGLISVDCECCLNTGFYIGTEIGQVFKCKHTSQNLKTDAPVRLRK